MSLIEPVAPTLSHATSDNRDYWHLVIANTAPGDWKLIPLQGNPAVDLGPYMLAFISETTDTRMLDNRCE